MSDQEHQQQEDDEVQYWGVTTPLLDWHVVEGRRQEQEAEDRLQDALQRARHFRQLARQHTREAREHRAALERALHDANVARGRAGQGLRDAAEERRLVRQYRAHHRGADRLRNQVLDGQGQVFPNGMRVVAAAHPDRPWEGARYQLQDAARDVNDPERWYPCSSPRHRPPPPPTPTPMPPPSADPDMIVLSDSD